MPAPRYDARVCCLPELFRLVEWLRPKLGSAGCRSSTTGGPRRKHLTSRTLSTQASEPPSAVNDAAGSARPRRRRTALVAGGIAAIIIVLAIILSTVPVERESITGTLTTAGSCLDCPVFHPNETRSLPDGSTVHVNWYEENGSSINFSGTNPHGTSVCGGSSWEGNCSFVSAGGEYTFAITPPPFHIGESRPVSYTVSYTLNYTQPII